MIVRHPLLTASLGVFGTSVLLCAGCAHSPRPDPCAVVIPQGCHTDEEIEQMPILDRPDRPGHFVGNAIRRIYRWHMGEPDPIKCP